ncbi:MAG: hypothetical protein ACKO8Q_00615 [Bacteroidota bacterium]
MKLIYTTLFCLAMILGGFVFSSYYLANDVTITLTHKNKISPGESALVQVKIDKEAIEGFGLIEIPIGSEFKAEAAELNGASFNVESGKIRIVWMKMPNEPVLNVSFNILYIGSGTAPIPLQLTGTFSHIENNYRKDLAFTSNGESAPIQHENIAENSTQTNSLTSIESEPKANETQISLSNSEEANKTPVEKLKFRVQILASHQVVNKSFLLKYYGFKNEFNIEHHNGWEKYVTGDFASLEEARAYRLKIANEHPLLPGPFVTAYRGSERIPVTEAIAVSLTASL